MVQQATHGLPCLTLVLHPCCQACFHSCDPSGRGCCLQGLLDIEAQCRGFLAVAKAATAQLVSSVYGDTAFLELYSKLCCSEEWKLGAITGSILATLDDYLGDFKRMLDEAFFKR